MSETPDVYLHAISAKYSVEQANLSAALVKAQSEVKDAVKDAANPFFKSTYADLASVKDACHAALTSNGLAVCQMPGYDPSTGCVTVSTRLMHSSGEWLEFVSAAPLEDKARTSQGVGSAITYLRRYALAALAFVAPEDDDGEGAVGRAGGSQRPAGTKKAPEAPPVSRPAPATSQGPVVPFGKQKGQPIASLDDAQLQQLKAWCEEKDAAKFARLIGECENEQESRRQNAT